MSPPPNELYSVFSGIGFVLCAIPFYWHLQAWNTGTCLYMIWAGTGCLIQCINSIVWNKNMVNRAPIYCDIVTRIQVAQNVAIPACSLCINRRLYKIATAKVAMTTSAERRRAVIQDLLIGVGLPILQIIVQYIVSSNRYDIYEDFGPVFGIVLTPLSFVLFYSWPVVVGTVSLFYCVNSIRTFYRRQRQFNQIMAYSQGLNRGRYLRLMALSATDIIGTIPLGTYFIVNNAKGGVTPWRGWAYTHSHYSHVFKVPSSVWKTDSVSLGGFETYRWSLVACAFVFFGFFGFADEARQQYRRLYMSIASRIGYSSFTHHGSSDATSSIPRSGVAVTVIGLSREKRRSSVSTDQTTISIDDDVKSELKFEQYSPSNTVTSSSVECFDDSKTQGQSSLPVTMPTIPPASVPPHFPGRRELTMSVYSGVNSV